MTQKKNEQTTPQSRRQFLEQLGGIGGSAAVYQAMVAMGLLVPGDSKAATNKANWQEKAALFASGPKPSVAVLGAGIAGLCVAYELKKAGFPVTIIEPRDRPGGRSHTLRAGSVLHETDSQQVCGFASGEDMYFNAGPARISQHHANLLNYCSELNVPLQAFVNDNRGAYIHSASAFGGKPVRAREVIAAMRGNISQLLAKSLNAGALDDEFTAGERAFVLAVLKDHGALNDFFHFTGTTRGGLAAGSGGLSPDVPATPLERNDVMLDANIAFVPSFVESYNQAATMMQPVGGMDRIAYAFAEQLQDEIFYGAEVSGIFRTGTGVRVEGRTATEQGALETDYVVVTIPPSVLRDIPNDFSPGIQTAIEQTQYANPTKIAFQSPRFWEKEEQIYGGISWTDSDILQIWYPSGGFGQDQGILVGSYLFGGGNATNFGNLSPSARIELALTAGEKMHSQYRANLSQGISVAWSKVPYSLGGWATSNPSPLLLEPDGPFLFAGDHLTYLRGWQEGAVISALNALSKLVDAAA